MSRIYNCTPHEMVIPNVVRCEGIHVFDDQGKAYMDLESGVWCTALGHTHPEITARMTEQIHTFMHAGFAYGSDILEAAAEAVLSVTGLEGGNCVFLCSGSEAIELARQIAKHLTGQKRSMTLHDSYLGSYSSVTHRESGWYIFNWEECMHCLRKESCDTGCEKLLEIPEDISEFIFEPGSSSGFVRFPPKALIQNMVGIVRSQGGKVIANEVTTGIGRTGKWFGYNHYDIVPDLVAMGKGIGNGYPVSVTAISGRTVRELEEKPFKYMQSHQNDPLGAAVAHEVIRIIKAGDLIARAEARGKKFYDMLSCLIDGIIVTGVRGRGLMFALDICDEETTDRLFKALIRKGILLGNRKSFFRIDPPLIMEEEPFAQFISEFRAVLTHTDSR